jgi:heat shock protein HspQ
MNYYGDGSAESKIAKAANIMDVFPFLHVAARNDYFEIINYLAHRQPARNNDDAGNSFAFGHPVGDVMRHCATIMGDD